MQQQETVNKANASSTSSSTTHSSSAIGSQTFKVITQYGDMLVVKQGNQHHYHHHHYHQATQDKPNQQEQSAPPQSRPVIMTFHDLGLNSELQFARFCECEEVKLMLQTFTMIHVNFIGQEFSFSNSTTTPTPNVVDASNESQTTLQSSANSSSNKSTNSSQSQQNLRRPACESLPSDFKYPNVEQMAESIVDICTQLRVRSFIALAVGAGAYVVASLALMRPDLVDGLFLINPIVSSCSITEWLYFKMSAIASNHHIRDNTQESGGSHDSPERHTPKHNTSGIRRLLDAAHIHLPNQTTNNSEATSTKSNNSKKTCEQSSETISLDQESNNNNNNNNSGQQERQELESQQSERGGENLFDSEKEFNQTQIKRSQQQGSQSSRLRKLILSRNFKLGTTERKHKHYGVSPSSSPSVTNESGGKQCSEKEKNMREDEPKKPLSRSGSGSSSSTINSTTRKTGNNEHSIQTHSDHRDYLKRPPLEYLMYHHFGPSSFQRYRRSSDTPLVMKGSNVGQASSSSTTTTTKGKLNETDEDELKRQREESKRKPQRASGDSSAGSSGPDSSENSPRSNWRSKMRPQRATSRSNDSLANSSSNINTGNQMVRNRSGSVNLSASHLASFPNERQRNAYLESVYKHYFCQVNPNNLWLLVQSFAKRKTLNLRKDCGAAAHAAAAAAALGTSICTAFVGISPNEPTVNRQITGGQGSMTTTTTTATSTSTSTTPASRLEKQDAISSGEQEQHQQRHNQQQQQQQQNQYQSDEKVVKQLRRQQSRQEMSVAGGCGGQEKQQSALVAGTKVKRTFTCQTLIMCSNVQMHCERAFKLMSLLNPLQATWIKTDHLLVLDERPEKVCQALRLFLQGIGYSMSTYERRLRLSSATGSASSADSNSSARSFI